MGLHHLKIFHSRAPWAHIAAVAGSHPPFAERAAAVVPSAKVFHDPLDCLRNTDIVAAVVATADDTHNAIVEACIARGIYGPGQRPGPGRNATMIEHVGPPKPTTRKRQNT